MPQQGEPALQGHWKVEVAFRWRIRLPYRQSLSMSRFHGQTQLCQFFVDSPNDIVAGNRPFAAVGTFNMFSASNDLYVFRSPRHQTALFTICFDYQNKIILTWLRSSGKRPVPPGATYMIWLKGQQASCAKCPDTLFGYANAQKILYTNVQYVAIIVLTIFPPAC